MNDLNPTPNGPQGNNPGETDPPLSPKASDVQREDEGSASQRARDPRRVPQPVAGKGRCSSSACFNDVASSFHDAVTRNPCGSLAVAFIAGILCGVLVAKVDYH